MYDLEDFLSGRLSIYCKNNAEVSGICDLMQEHGIDVGSLRAVGRGSFRVDASCKKPRGAYSGINAEWHVRNGFVQRWMYFVNFWASCGLSDPQISIPTLEGLV